MTHIDFMTTITEHVRGEIRENDFTFLRRLVAELRNLPTSKRVKFPLHNRQSTYADIEVNFSYNRDDHPQGEFFVVSRHHGLEMAHTVVVTPQVRSSSLWYHLQVRPNASLRHRGHRSIVFTRPDAKTAALDIARTYAIGLGTRKVVVSEQAV